MVDLGATMPSGDGEQGAIPPTQEERMAEMMEALMKTRAAIRGHDGKKDESWRTRHSGQGVNIGRSSLTPGDLEVASREELVESASANVRARGFSSLKQAVRKFSGLPEYFPVWSKRFQAFMSVNGCLISIFTDI